MKKRILQGLYTKIFFADVPYLVLFVSEGNDFPLCLLLPVESLEDDRED